MKGLEGIRRCRPRLLRACAEDCPPTSARGVGDSTLVAVQEEMEIAVSVSTATQEAVRAE